MIIAGFRLASEKRVLFLARGSSSELSRVGMHFSLCSWLAKETKTDLKYKVIKNPSICHRRCRAVIIEGKNKRSKNPQNRSFMFAEIVIFNSSCCAGEWGLKKKLGKK